MEEYQRWKYNATCEQNKMAFDVVPFETISKPGTFFKYYSVNENNVEALTNYYVYATHPNQFNDSVDCNSQILDFKTASDKDLQTLYEGFYNQFLDLCGSEEALKDYAASVFKTIAYRKVGLVSLATNNDSIYFWNPYAESGRGFCVEWDVEKFPFQKYGPFPIHYVDKIERFEVRNNVMTSLLIQTNIKTKDWENEHEWRLLVSNPPGVDFNSWENDGSCSEIYKFGDESNRKMKIPIEAVKSVTLGERFFRSPYIRCYNITSGEGEIVFLNNKKETLRCKVLNFLAAKKIETKLIANNLGVLVSKNVEIVQLENRIYRIICK